jgi:hypothetical protein
VKGNDNLPVYDALTTTTYDANIPKPPSTSYLTARTGMNLNSWDVSFFVDNLFNSTDILTRGHRSRTWPAYTDTTFRPRTFFVQASFHY